MTKVLIIEKDDCTVAALSQMLQMANYEVLCAKDGPEGIEKALQSNADIVISGINLPTIDGYGVLHILKSNNNFKNTVFLLLTDQLEWREIRNAIDLGVEDFILKPLNCSEILNTLSRRLQKHQELRLNVHINHQTNHAHSQDLKDVVQDRDTLVFRKKQQIYREGGRPHSMYYIVKGIVKEYKTNDDGKEFIINLYKEGDFFGHIALFEKTTYTDSTEAIEDTELISIPAEEFNSFLLENTAAMQHFIKLLTHNIKEQEDKLINIAYNSLRKKVAEALVLLHHKICSKNPQTFIEMSRDNMAAIVGVAKESLIRTLKDFKDESLIDLTHNKVRVINLKKLECMLN